MIPFNILLVGLLCWSSLVRAACSIPSNGATFTGSGSLLSDQDGAGDVYRYRPSETCSWTIDCGSTGYVAFLQFLGSTAQGSDSLTVQTSAGNMFVRRFLGFDDAFVVSVAGPVTLLWSSASIPFFIQFPRNFGFSLQWQCINRPLSQVCTSRNSSLSNSGSSVTADQGTLISELDGSGETQMTIAGDSCAWTVSCATTTSFLLISATGRLFTNSSFYFPLSIARTTNNVSLLPLNSFTGLVGLGSFADASSVNVLYSELPLSSLFMPRASRTGFTLTWKCFPEKCVSPNGTAVSFGSTSLATSGIILSDDDGVSSTSLTPGGTSCTWSLVCPTNMQVVISDLFISFTNSSLALLTVSDKSTGKALYAKRFAAGYGLLTRTSSVDVLLDTGRSEASPGVSFKYSCLAAATTCLSPNASITTTIATSKTSLTSSSPMYQGETCQWSLTCPSGYNFIIITETGTFGRNDSLSYFIGNKLNRFVGTSAATSGGLKVTGLLSAPASSVVVVNVTTALANQSIPTDTTDLPTDRVAYTPSWNLDVTCTLQQCTSNTAGQTFTSSFGVIYSDADGQGSATKTSSSEDCSWTVVCPSGYSNVAFSIAGELGFGSATVTQSGTNEMMTFVGTITQSSSFTTSGNTFSVKMQTYGQNNGVTIGYTCNNGRCSSINGTGLTLTSDSGVIVSDLDGSGSDGRVVAGEDCTWLVQCPAQTFFNLNTFVMSNPARSMALSITNVDSTKLLLNMTRSLSNVMTDASRVALRFTTIDVPGDPRFGFTLRYSCLPAACQSPNASLVTTTLTSATGTLLSDDDGFGFGQYVPSQICRWTVQCPTGVFSINSLSYGLGQGDFLDIATVSGISLDRFTDTALSVYEAFNVSSVVITFFVDQQINRRGFSLDYKCVDPLFVRCQSPNATGSVYTVASGVLVSDRDGAGNQFKYMNNDKCSWQVKCPIGYTKIATKTTLTVPTVPGDVLQILDPTTMETMISLESSVNGFATTFDMNSILVTFDADAALVDSGFQLQFECRGFASDSTVCSSPTPSGSVILAPGGSILSDDDGARTNALTTRGNCGWRLQCTDDSSFIMINLEGVISSGDTLTLANTSQSAVVFSSLDGSASVKALIVAGGASLAFAPNMSSAVIRTGFTFSYICVRSLCRTASTPEGTLSALNGTLYSSGYVSGERCHWDVVCPALSYVIQFTIRGGFPANDRVIISTNRVPILTATNRTALDADLVVTAQSSTASIDVVTDARNYALGNPYWIVLYSCIPAQLTPSPKYAKTCTKDRSLPLGSSGFVGFAKSEVISSNEYCDWSINCNDGSLLFVTVLSDSADVALTVRGAAGEHQTFTGVTKLGLVLGSRSGYFLVASSSATVGQAGFQFSCLPASSAVAAAQSRTPSTDGSRSAVLGANSNPDSSILTCSAGDVTFQGAEALGTLTASQGIFVATPDGKTQQVMGPGRVTLTPTASFVGPTLLVAFLGGPGPGIRVSYSCPNTPKKPMDGRLIGVIVGFLLLLVVVGALVFLLRQTQKKTDRLKIRSINLRTNPQAIADGWGLSQEMGPAPGASETDVVKAKNAALGGDRFVGEVGSSSEDDNDDDEEEENGKDGTAVEDIREEERGVSQAASSRRRSEAEGHLGGKIANRLRRASGGGVLPNGPESDSDLCRLCTVNLATFAAQPCGHRLFCSNCVDPTSRAPCMQCGAVCSGPPVQLQFYGAPAEAATDPIRRPTVEQKRSLRRAPNPKVGLTRAGSRLRGGMTVTADAMDNPASPRTTSPAEGDLCSVCQMEPATTACLPCGHVSVCTICKPSTCPSCGSHASGFMNVS
jgi:hypothetical protein